MLQELNQDGGGNNGIGESAVGYKGRAPDTERVNQTELITQGLAAVGCQLRPDPQRAFVRADPDGLPNMPIKKRPLERAIVSDVGIGTGELLDYVLKGRERISDRRR